MDRVFPPERETELVGQLTEGENAWNHLFFVAQSEKPVMIHNVERESGGEVDLYGGGPIQKRETRNTNRPGGNQTGEHEQNEPKESR